MARTAKAYDARRASYNLRASGAILRVILARALGATGLES